MNSFLKFALLDLTEKILLLRCYEQKEDEFLSDIESNLRLSFAFEPGEIKRYSFYKQKINSYFLNSKNKNNLYNTLNSDDKLNTRLIAYDCMVLINYIEYYYSTDPVIENEYTNLIKLKNYLVRNYV